MLKTETEALHGSLARDWWKMEAYRTIVERFDGEKQDLRWCLMNAWEEVAKRLKTDPLACVGFLLMASG